MTLHKVGHSTFFRFIGILSLHTVMNLTFSNGFKLVASIVFCESVGIIGSTFMSGYGMTWYAHLLKPTLNPPNWIFAPVWTVLYFLMGISLFLVWKNDWKVSIELSPKEWKKSWNKYSDRLWTGSWQKTNIISIFTIQLLLNLLWTFIFFGLRQPGYAFFELCMLWVSIIYTVINFYRVSQSAAYLLLPYFFWVTFAGYLNVNIWLLN